MPPALRTAKSPSQASVTRTPAPGSTSPLNLTQSLHSARQVLADTAGMVRGAPEMPQGVENQGV
jgi:hypothetical protein